MSSIDPQDISNSTSASGANASTDDFSITLTNDSVQPRIADTTNCPSKPIYRVQEEGFIVIKGLLMVLIMLTAIIGNLLVIVSVLRFERLRLIANTFIVSLALTDLLVACFVMPFSASKELADGWMFGQVLCDLFNANDVLFCTASLLNLCCISVDR